MENITKEKWYNITNEHILKAIEEFENSPNKYHAARNTFLMYNGNKYPAKTIRGCHNESCVQVCRKQEGRNERCGQGVPLI